MFFMRRKPARVAPEPCEMSKLLDDMFNDPLYWKYRFEKEKKRADKLEEENLNLTFGVRPMPHTTKLGPDLAENMQETVRVCTDRAARYTMEAGQTCCDLYRKGIAQGMATAFKAIAILVNDALIAAGEKGVQE